MDVIGFGAINLDETHTVASSFFAARPELAPGSEETVDATAYRRLARDLMEAGATRETFGGGQAANTVSALARMGLTAAIVGSVGADDEGTRLLEELAPVDTSQVARGGRTARCAVILDERGERTIRVLPALDPPVLDPVAAWDALGGATLLHLTSLAPVERLALQVGLVEHLPPGVRVSLDPGELYSRLGVEELSSLLRRTQVLFVTEREAAMLAGGPPPESCGRLLSVGPSVVVCKMGAAGAKVFSDGGVFTVPAKRVQVVDPTGAGDVFAAGFLVGLGRGLSLEGCAALGTAAAAQSVTGRGRSTYPGPELLESVGGRS